MKFIMSVIRSVLSWIIQLLDWITRPKPIERSEAEQERVNRELENMALYEFEG